MNNIDSDGNKDFPITVKDNKQPSKKLLALINEFVDTGIKFTEMVNQIWEQGSKEGFSKQEIADIIRPIARQKGLNKDQVYYLTHKPEMLEKSKMQYIELKDRNIPIDDSKPDSSCLPINSISKTDNCLPINSVLVQDWKLEDLAKYDRQFLIGIIRYLNQNITSGAN